MAASLADALLLMHDAGDRFATVRMTVRRWQHHDRLLRAWRRDEDDATAAVIRVAPPGGEGGAAPAETTHRTRVWWRPPDHARVENEPGGDGPQIEVAAGPRGWAGDPDFGASSNEPSRRSAAAPRRGRSPSCSSRSC